MAYTPQSFNETYIGEVKAYNTVTRTVDVFIPKLMPAIPNGRKDIETLTNLGNKYINIKYKDKIKLSSTITANALNADDPMPNIGSKVRIKFLEGRPQYCIWEKININFDYEVIPEEKYPKIYYLKIGDKNITVNNDDIIEIELPEEYSVVYLEEDKHKKIRIISNSESDKNINELFDKIGHKKGTITKVDILGEMYEEETEGSGILKEIDELKEKVNALTNILFENKDLFIKNEEEK